MYFFKYFLFIHGTLSSLILGKSGSCLRQQKSGVLCAIFPNNSNFPLNSPERVGTGTISWPGLHRPLLLAILAWPLDTTSPVVLTQQNRYLLLNPIVLKCAYEALQDTVYI